MSLSMSLLALAILALALLRRRPPSKGEGPQEIHRIEARCVSKAYRTPEGVVLALRDAGLMVDPAQWRSAAIVGESGAGKSTLLNMLGGLDGQDSGELLLDGVPLPTAEGAELSAHRRGIALIMQDGNLIAGRTAEENAALKLLVKGISWREALRRAREALSFVGLAGLGSRFPNQLSGGQQLRVAIARALASGSWLLLADEPSASLDSGNADRIFDLLARCAEQCGSVVLVVTHDRERAKRFDRIFEIRDGVLSETNHRRLEVAA